MEVAQGTSFVAIIPVKPPRVGKSRLTGLDDSRRIGLAEAFAIDTVRAAASARLVQQVLVVTDDAALAGRVVTEGAHALPDGDTNDLNATLVQAAREGHRRWPALRPVVVCADLPCLTGPVLDEVLHRIEVEHPGSPGFVPDADGVGTVLYSTPVESFDPWFGFNSREAHLRAGAHEIADAPAQARRDVDDPPALRAALELGVGAATRRAAEDLTGLE